MRRSETLKEGRELQRREETGNISYFLDNTWKITSSFDIFIVTDVKKLNLDF